WREVDAGLAPRLAAIEAAMAPRADDLGTLEFDAATRYPAYYRFDFHRQAGGIWRDARGAAAYLMGARIVHVGRNNANELHDRFAADLGPLRPRRVLDLGCGFGKTTWSLKARFPDAEVHGIDLAAPCLALGRRIATERGL